MNTRQRIVAEALGVTRGVSPGYFANADLSASQNCRDKHCPQVCQNAYDWGACMRSCYEYCWNVSNPQSSARTPSAPRTGFQTGFTGARLRQRAIGNALGVARGGGMATGAGVRPFVSSTLTEGGFVPSFTPAAAIAASYGASTITAANCAANGGRMYLAADGNYYCSLSGMTYLVRQ